MTSLTAQPGRRPRAATSAGAARLAALGLVAMALFLGLLALVEQGWAPLARLDDAARDRLHAVAVDAPAFVWSMKAVSAVGTISAYSLLLVVLVAVLLRQGRGPVALFAVVAVVGGSLLNTGVKALVDRARPLLDDPVAHAGHSSFPSGHAQGVLVAAGVLLVVLRPHLRPGRRQLAAVALGAWVLLMGFSRVALGVHYVSDVLGGYLLALVWLPVCAAVLAPWRRVS